MNEDRHIIWSNYDLDYEDWKDDLEADYPDLSEQERIALMYEINGDYLDDERMNLNLQLSAPILVIGDLGLWNGRRMGYKEIASGNIRDCLYSDTDYSTWYVDRLGDLRCDAIHHDGTNHLFNAFGCNESWMIWSACSSTSVDIRTRWPISRKSKQSDISGSEQSGPFFTFKI